MDVDVRTACTQCEAPLDETDKYCPDCGEAVPLLNLHADADDQPQIDLAFLKDPRLRSRRTVLIAGVAFAAMAALIWVSTRDSATQRQYNRSARVLMSTVDQLSSARSAQDVRTAAQAAAAELPAVESALAKDPASTDAARLLTMRSAFVYLADQQEFRDSDTSIWSTERAALLNTMEDLSDNGGQTLHAAQAGRSMARHLDELADQVEQAAATPKAVNGPRRSVPADSPDR